MRALFSLLQEALGLVKETCVFDGNAHVGGEGLQEAQVVFIKCTGLQALNIYNAQYFFADHDGHTHIRLRIFFIIWCSDISLCAVLIDLLA